MFEIFSFVENKIENMLFLACPLTAQKVRKIFICLTYSKNDNRQKLK